jgi:tetratricopeptide (TPR) repeat protein
MSGPHPPPIQTAAGSVPTAAGLLPGFLLILGAVFLVFGRALAGELVYDDLLLIGANPTLSSLANIPEAFSAAYWDFLGPAAERIGYWRPLTAIALTLTHALSGGSVTAFHALSLLLHGIAALILWRLAATLFGDGPLPLLTALLFALHPAQVESVAWISAVNNPLFGALGLGLLLAHLRWRRTGAASMPWLPALLLAASLLAKEHALALPVVLLALDQAVGPPTGETASAKRTRLMHTWVPLFAVLALYHVSRCLVFGSLLGGFDRITSHFGVGVGRLVQMRLEFFGGFLQILAWPWDLNLFRPFRPEIPAGDGTWLVALCACILWLAAVVLSRRSGNRRTTGLLLFLPAALAPVLLAVRSVGQFPLSERYLYLAVAGFALLVTAVAARHLPRRTATLLLALLVAAFGLRSHLRLPDWANEEALFRAATANDMEQPSPYPHWGLGRVLLNRYQETGHQPYLDEALFEFLVSLSAGWDYGTARVDLDPRRPLAERLADMSVLVGSPPPDRHRDAAVLVTVDDRLQANLGQAWCHLYFDSLPGVGGDMGRSRAIFEAVLSTFPMSHEAHTGLGCVQMAQGRLDEAIAAFDAAIALHPDYAEAHHNRGQALFRAGRFGLAAEAFLRAEARRPGHLKDLTAAARALLDSDRPEDMERARRVIARARAVAGDHPEVLLLQSVQAARAGDLTSSLIWSGRAIEAAPDHGPVWLHRGKILLALDRKPEAVTALKRACEELPGSFEAHYNLGVLVLGGGDRTAALPFLVRAYGLRGSAPADPAGESSASALAMVLAEFASKDPGLASALARVDESVGLPEDALAWVEMALDQRRATLAAEDGEPRFLSLASDDAALRARLLTHLDRPDEVRTSLEQALQWTPDHFQARHDLGVLLAGVDPQAARPHLVLALELLNTQTLEPGLRKVIRAGLEEALRATAGTGDQPR